MRYKIYEPREDKTNVVEFLKKYELPEPSDDSFGIVCYDDNEVKACAFLRNEVYIEPFASENPMVGFKLFNMLVGAVMSLGIDEIYADISYHRENSYSIFRILRKLGFEIVNSGMTLKKKI